MGLVAILSSRQPIIAQVITTVAGNGKCAYTSEQSATASSLSYPTCLAVDALRNVYFSDERNNRIRKVTTTGHITTIAGDGNAGFSGDDGPATNASLYAPKGIALDAPGNVYFADALNNRVRRVSIFGKITTIAGTGIAGYSGDDGPATAARLNAPSGVSVDPAGNVYIADEANHRIRKVNKFGVITTVAGNGQAGYAGDMNKATDARLTNPSGVVVDESGNVYIADRGNNCVRMINTTGFISTLAGTGIGGYSGDTKSSRRATLNYPCDVAVDALSNLYIVDYGNHCIRVVATTGVITTIAGNGQAGFAGDGEVATAARLSYPTGIAIDVLGNLFIADHNNCRIRKCGKPTIAKMDKGDERKKYARVTYNATTAQAVIKSAETMRSIYVTDIGGRVVAKTIGNEREYNIDLSRFPTGEYIVTIAAESGLQEARIKKE